MAAANEIVKLNVGGMKYETTAQTLKKYPSSMLGRMFASDIPPRLDSEGYIFLDANGDMFNHILHYLRNDTFDLPNDFTNINALKSTINYFSLPEMMERLEEWTAETAPPKTQLLEVLATKMDVVEGIERTHRWVYIKREGDAFFTPVLTNEKGKDSGRILNTNKKELFGAYSKFCRVLLEDTFDSHSNVMAVVSVMGVKDIDTSFDFEKDLEYWNEGNPIDVTYGVKLYERK